jgi:hypothetical protein
MKAFQIQAALNYPGLWSGGGEITDNPKAWLKQKQLKHGTKWI